MKGSALTVQAVVRDGQIAVVTPHYSALRAKAAKRWGDGAAIVIRIEPEEEAVSAGQRRYYFGRIVGPLVDYTGYHQDEWHEMLKATFFPDDGRTSITQLSHDEMRDYMARCEQHARERHPDAFALTERDIA